MIDVQEFGRDFREKLISVAAESRGCGRIESVRRYHTDLAFRSQVDAIVQAAVQVLMNMEQASNLDPLRQTFQEEVGGLLGWQH